MARKAGREFTEELNPPDTNVFISWAAAVGTPPVKTPWGQLKTLIAAAMPKPDQPIIIPVSNQTSALTAGAAKFTFRAPYALDLTAIPRASLKVAQASGSLVTVDIKVAGVSILSTLLTIDNTEKTSKTAAAPAVLSTTAIADDAEIAIDVAQIGNGSAIGLVVTLLARKAA